MTNHPSSYERLNDADLLAEVATLVTRERTATVQLIVALGELDLRRLYLAQGCSSLFTYCTQVLRLSEHAAYGRIEAARAARKWPVVLDMLADGSLHLTAITLLSRHLTTDNHETLLAAARHKSKREVEQIIAALRPQPAVPASVRKLPEPSVASRDIPLASTMPTAAQGPAGTVRPQCTQPERSTMARGPEVKPLSPASYKVQFTVSQETQQKVREVQDLMRHRVPSGDIAVIFDRAISMLLAELRRERHAACPERSRRAVTRALADRGTAPRGRHIPAAVKREVWDRDAGRCAFIGESGRCTERGFLEYHHIVPFAEGGGATAQNLQLRCRAHNAFEAERWFGTAGDGVVREATPHYASRPW